MGSVFLVELNYIVIKYFQHTIGGVCWYASQKISSNAVYMKKNVQ